MQPLTFDPNALRKHLLRRKIAALPEIKAVLGTTTDLTVGTIPPAPHQRPTNSNRST